MNIVGKTEDGKVTVVGVYRICASHGLPLDIVLSYLLSRNAVPAWDEYILEGLKEGAKFSTLTSKIESAFIDVGIRLNDRQKSWLSSKR